MSSAHRDRSRRVVFDFDGLDPRHRGPGVHGVVRGVRGARLPAADDRGVGGTRSAPTPTPSTWSSSCRDRAQRPVDLDAMHARRRAHRDELLAAEVVRPGVHRMARRSRRGRPRRRDRVELARRLGASHLERLGLRARFAHVVCCGTGRPAKPAPDTYLAACAALGVRARAARSRSRIRRTVSTAAKAAGLRVHRGAARDHRDARSLARRPPARRHSRTCSLREAIARIATDAIDLAATAPRARCPATGRAPTRSRPGRTPTRATAARRRDRGGPRDSRSTFQVVGANWYAP